MRKNMKWAMGLFSLLLAGSFTIAACTSTQVNKAVLNGQLVCATGPTVVAMYNAATGNAISASGATKAFVDAVCATINGIAVSPPDAPVPSVHIIVPPITVPLKT